MLLITGGTGSFGNAFAIDLPYTVIDSSVELDLLYIDDLVDEMIAALRGFEHHCEFSGLDVLPSADGIGFRHPAGGHRQGLLHHRQADAWRFLYFHTGRRRGLLLAVDP